MTEVGNFAAPDSGAPFIQLPPPTLPEILAEREVLQYDARLALLKEFLGEGHVRSEAAELRRTRRGTRRQQVLIRLLELASLYRNTAQYEVAIKDGVSIIPILGIPWRRL